MKRTARFRFHRPLLTLAVILAATGTANASILKVPAQYPTIQAAINAAHQGGTILVAAGTYSGNGFDSIDTLGKALTLRATGACTLSGNANNPIFNIHSQETGKTLIQGFTLTNTYSGAVTITDASPKFSGCDFSANGEPVTISGTAAPTFGQCSFTANTSGALDIEEGAAPLFSACSFVGNGGGLLWFAGAMYCNASSPTFERCSFVGNSVQQVNFDVDGNGGGGALYIDINSNVALQECEFIGNTSQGASAQGIDDGGAAVGGAISAVSSTLTLVHCDFRNNVSTGGAAASDTGGDSLGGAIYAEGCALSVASCSFISNAAMGGSGGASQRFGKPGNAFGGAIDLYGGSLTLVNSLVVANAATGGTSVHFGNGTSDGGGLLLTACTNVLANDTFTLNTGALSGGALSYDAESGGSLTLGNCILWNDSSEIGGKPDTVLYSDVEGGYSGPGLGNLNVDPRFVAPKKGDFRLQNNSPCVDAGSSTVPDFVPWDIQGRPRDTSAPDMGAYENPAR